MIHPASLAALIICLFSFVGPTRPRPDPDTWWHLATGRSIAETGSLPKVDPFSWTAAGRAWVPHEWLSQLTLAQALETFGAASLLVISAVCIGTAMVLLLATMKRLGANPWARAIALGTAVYLSTITWSLRPHVFSIFLFSVFLYLLVAHRADAGSRSIWILVPLTVLWANLHGVWVVGLALVWIFAVDELLRRHGRKLAWIALLASGAALLNPNGIGAYGYPLHVARVSGDILEWAPPGFRDPYGAAFILLVIGVPSLYAWTRRRPESVLGVAGLLFSLMGMAAVKNVWMAGMVLAPLLALALTGLKLPEPKPAQGTEKKFLIALAGVMTAIAVGYAANNLTASEAVLLREDGFPIAAVNALNELPPGDVINPYYWGGYLIWAAPRFPVSIDGRNDMYGLTLLTEDLKLEFLRPGWDEFLERPNVRYVLWNRDGALAQAMALLDGWELVYGDAKAVLYERSG